MKKLGKLKLNPEKMIKQDELVSFRGGSDDGYSCSNVCIHGGFLDGCRTCIDDGYVFWLCDC
jgi:hypothetical protein